MFQKGSTGKKKITPISFFVIAVALSAAVYALIYIILGNGKFAEVFFSSGKDFFMDFFNSIRDASQGSGAYTERRVIYPPMANLIFLIFSRLTPTEYNHTLFGARGSWTAYPSSFVLVMLCTAVCAVFVFYAVYAALKKGSSTRKFIFAFFTLFSMPVLFMLERGNILVLCFVALIVYAATYNSESKLHREIGLICLAFAFSLKLYPVVFGWFLIVDKRKKDALRCFIYGMILLILPSLFFGGPICIYQMFRNIFSFSAGSGSTFARILHYLKIPSLGMKIFTVVAYLWVAVLGICFAVSSFLFPDKVWRTWTLGLVTLMCVPSMTSVYNWAFFIIPIIMLCNQKEALKKLDWTYVVLLTLGFLFIPGGAVKDLPVVIPVVVFVYIMSAVLSIFAVTEFLVDTIKYLVSSKAKRSTQE